MTIRLLQGDCREVMATLPAQSVHATITSPPYWGLRDYGLPPLVWGGREDCDHLWINERHKVANNNGRGASTLNCLKPGYIPPYHEQQAGTNAVIVTGFCHHCNAWRGSLGLEPTPALYVSHLVEVMRGVWRVLRDDGTCWMNIGDASSTGKRLPMGDKQVVGIPWMVAFALREAGWIIRSSIIWAKGISFCPTYSGSCMPESAKDRPTNSYEYVFLLTKKARYFYDSDAVRERTGREATWKEWASADGRKAPSGNLTEGVNIGFGSKKDAITHPAGRNLRSVWTIPDAETTFAQFCATQGVDLDALVDAYQDGQRDAKNVFVINPHGFKGAHFATFPPALVRPMILAGTSERGVCAECGGPWERVVEMTPEYRAVLDSGKAWQDRSGSPDGLVNRHPKGHPSNLPQKNITLGWKPTCQCDAGDPVPATVLDPFGGSGTVGLVSRQLGRDAILIDLSPNYIEMAELRLAGVEIVEYETGGELHILEQGVMFSDVIR